MTDKKQNFFKISLTLIVSLLVIVFPYKAQESVIKNQPEILGVNTEKVELSPVIKKFPEYSNIIPSPTLSSRSAAAFVLNTDFSLFSMNADEKLPIASLTKIMTAIVALEHSKPSDRIAILNEDVLVEGNKIGIKAEEIYSLESLIEGMLIASGNDAAHAIARSTVGSTDKFIELMNEKAKDLKMRNTSFSNPIGLDSDDNYSTAQDLFILSKEFLKFPLFKKTVQIKERAIFTVDKQRTIPLKNTNKLLYSDPRVLGIKTGFTTLAKGNLITRILFFESDIIVIILNSDNREGDSQNLMDWRR